MQHYYNLYHNSAERQFRKTKLILAGLVVISSLLLVGVRFHSNHSPSGLTADGSASSTARTTVVEPHILAPKALGIAAGSSLTSLSDQALASRLDGIKASGARWLRFDFDWSIIQPDNAQTYNWTAYDKLVAASQQRDLKILGIITYTPDWARDAVCKDSSKCKPADAHSYASFAAALVSRYKDHGVHAWEIWNEPNNPQFWQPRSSPSDYSRLLKASYPAIKQLDATAIVLTAGLSPQATSDDSYSPIDFLSKLYAAGAKGYFDAIADHPYTFPLSPSSSEDHAWNQMAAAKHSLRQIMVDNGDGVKQIWITEFGSPTGGPGAQATVGKLNLSAHPYKVDDALQAKILSDALKLYEGYDWVGPFMYYSYQDDGIEQDTNENFFGLLRADGSAKPAQAVFKDAAARFTQ